MNCKGIPDPETSGHQKTEARLHNCKRHGWYGIFNSGEAPTGRLHAAFGLPHSPVTRGVTLRIQKHGCDSFILQSEARGRPRRQLAWRTASGCLR